MNFLSEPGAVATGFRDDGIRNPVAMALGSDLRKGERITMAKVDRKVVREKCNVMNDAWFEGAPPPNFNGITQAAFLADITAAAADDATIGDLEAELKMKREVRW